MVSFGVCLCVWQRFSQVKTYNSPDVNIYESPEQDFELPGSGDYIPAEQIREYNFQNINDILKTQLVYTQEDSFGLFQTLFKRCKYS